MENEETSLVGIQNFGEIANGSTTKASTYTNIKDAKKIFNLENHVDCLLNDCEGELINVKEVLIKKFEKPMKEPIINEQTGEIEKDTEITMSCILIDNNGKSYATGSKIFTIQMMRYLQMFKDIGGGFTIKIVKNKQTTGNKALGFELV